MVRYSPSGEVWASGGFDGKMFLYDGKESTLLDEFKSGDASAHSGGVYGLSFSPDSKQMLSASGDKTCKIWDVETRKVVSEYSMGSDVTDQQLGCLWSKFHLLSVSLKGNINFIDPRTPGAISNVIQGHNKPITAFAKGEDHKTVFTGDSEGRVVQWSTENGDANEVKGNGPTSQVTALSLDSDKVVKLTSMDDCLRRVKDGSFEEFNLKFNAQPRAMAIGTESKKTFVATYKSFIVLENDQVSSETNVDYEPSCIAISEELKHIAIGEGGNNKMNVHIYDINTLDEVKQIKLSGQVTDLAYSMDNQYLVTADSNRKVTLFAAPAYERANNKEWGFHTAKVTCVAWSPDSKLVASGGLDCSVILWSVDNPAKHHILLSAHVQSQITGLKWMDSMTLASTGQDGNIKVREFILIH